jgi:hypothetical protein
MCGHAGNVKYLDKDRRVTTPDLARSIRRTASGREPDREREKGEMTTSANAVEDGGIIGGIGRHRVLAPFALGFASGLTASGYVLGGVIAGYLVGRSSAGSRGRLIGSVGSVIGTASFMTWLIASMVNNGCPSCIDAVIVGWIVPFMFLVPFLIGCAIGAWRRRRVRPAAVPIQA